MLTFCSLLIKWTNICSPNLGGQGKLIRRTGVSSVGEQSDKYFNYSGFCELYNSKIWTENQNTARYRNTTWWLGLINIMRVHDFDQSLVMFWTEHPEPDSPFDTSRISLLQCPQFQSKCHEYLIVQNNLQTDHLLICTQRWLLVIIDFSPPHWQYLSSSVSLFQSKCHGLVKLCIETKLVLF